jgi:UDP-4-amino-4,6-dideoxy-N-acetyl-beta-L-altrosamine N-acetyltransferase
MQKSAAISATKAVCASAMNARTEKTASAVAVRLLPLAEADAEQIEALRLLRNLPAVREHLFTSHEIGPKEHSEWAGKMRTDENAMVFVALLGERVVGQASLTSIDRENGQADWGFYVDPDLRRIGVATSMLAKLANRFFSIPEMRRIRAGVLEGNAESIGLHEKFGFADDGRQKGYKCEADGRESDRLNFSLTRESWMQRRASLAAGDKE